MSRLWLQNKVENKRRYPDALQAGRYASCTGRRVHETPPAKQADPGHPKGQPMRKRRARGQQAAASGAFSWVVFYAFRSLFYRGLDNLSRLLADHAGKALPRLGFHRPKCVDRRYLFRCRLASFFRCMAASVYDLYLHSIIHIFRLVFFGYIKYNRNVD